MSTSTDGPLSPKEIALHKGGRTASAIKEYRVRHVCGLEEAKEAFALFDKNERIEQLLHLRAEAGDRRDGAACDSLDADLFKLTGDPKYAPEEDT
jgi:hypothetical protein